MGKRKKVILAAVIIAIILVMILAAAAIYKMVAPSNVKKELNSVFELKENEVALIIDDAVREERGYKIDGETYVPAAVASDYMDERIFVDDTEEVLSYASADGLIQAEVGEVSYRKDRNREESKAPFLIKQGDSLYVAMTFIQEHASCYLKEYSSPDRIVVMSDRTKAYTFGTLNSNTRLRTGPGKKYPYLVEITEGSRVFIEKSIQQENEYMAITTEDGITGYVPIERVEKGEEAAWKFDKQPASFEQNAMDGTVCLAWHQVTNDASSASLPGGIGDATPMNVLSVTWFALSDNKGNYTSLANSSYVAQAHAANRKVWGLINDFGESMKGEKLKLGKILGTTSIRTKLVNALVASAIQYDLDGLNIDFEFVTADSADAYLEFLRELTLKCHANGIVVSVDNYNPADYNAFYNLEEQGRVVDYVILMAYDEHYRGGGKSGSVSSLGFVQNGVETAVAKVPKERIITALPFYTRLWKEVKTKSGEKKVTSPGAYGMSAAESLLRENGASSKWDEKTGQYYAQYKKDGATYKIWLEEETSLEKKIEVVKKCDVAGVAFWKLGFERAVTWKTIAEALK